MIGFETCLIPTLIYYSNIGYNIKLFISINTQSLNDMSEIDHITRYLYDKIPNLIGNIHFENYKLPKSYVLNKIKYNMQRFEYNEMSCFYNNKKNIENIEIYEKENNINFDIICNYRSDIILNQPFKFNADDVNSLILHTAAHGHGGKYWGHVYDNIPNYISGIIDYGNKRTMQKYATLYEWIIEQNIIKRGQYQHGAETMITDCMLNYVFYNIPGGEHIPLLSRDEIMDKFNNTKDGLKIKYETDIRFQLLQSTIRQKTNKLITVDNVMEFTEN